MKITVVKGRKLYMDEVRGKDGVFSHRVDDLSKKNTICDILICGERLQIARAAFDELLALLGLDRTATLSYAVGSNSSYDKVNRVYSDSILFPRDLDGDFLPVKVQDKIFLDRVRESAWKVRRMAR